MVKPKSLSKRTRPGRTAPGKNRRPANPEAGGPPDAEKRILAAARKEFIAKGLSGARMQAVASEAGVNKALLHYYFRSKEKLYQRVLEDTVGTVWGTIGAEFRKLDPAQGLEPLLRTVVSAYVKVLAANPDFPLFVFREMANGNPAFAAGIPALARDFREVPDAIVKALREEIRSGQVRPIPPVHFFMNLIGMTVTTFLIMPLIKRLGPSVGIRIDFDQAFLDERIGSIVDTLFHGIRAKR